MVSSLRTFLKNIQEEIITIEKEVDPKTQVGDLCSQSDRPLLFKKVKGYPHWKICDLLVKARKTQAIALGTTPDRLLPELARRLRKGPGETRLVEEGPVKEKILMGEKADLTKIPICMHSPKDGGPYIGSGMCVVKDPDTGIQNVAPHRFHVKSESHGAIGVFSPHSWAILRKYEEKKEPAPMAVVIGHHPCYEIATNFHGPHEDFSEHDLAGALLNETVELVKCEFSNIEVPAHAEIVIEGEIPPGVGEDEGPFGEFFNYYGSDVEKRQVFKVKAITMRSDAIYRHLQATGYTDHQSLCALQAEARLYDQLKNKGILVHDIFIPPWGSLFVTIIKLTPQIEEEVKEVLLMTLFSPVFLPFINKIVIAVDEDIDIYDARDIFYSIATRVNPATDVTIISGVLGFPTDCSIPKIPGGVGFLLRSGGKLGINATKPSLFRAEERAKLERIDPKGWGKVFLKDFIK